MTAVRQESSSVCYVLQEDPELADAIEPALRAHALATVVAPEIELPAGRLRRRVGHEDALGALILEGVMLHRIGVDRRFGAELLGAGDVLRAPYRQDPSAAAGTNDWLRDESTLALTNDWMVLERSRLALLDERFVLQLANFPQLAGRLLSRAVARARQLAINMAIVHQARVDVRLHMLLWHLAGRWGRVRQDGVVVPLRLTHTVLADLVAARRPTVTAALSDLSRRGVVHSVKEGWLLSGDPPTLGASDSGANAKPD